MSQNETIERLTKFIENKESELKRKQKIAYYGANTVKWIIFFSNIIVVSLAIAVIIIEINRYQLIKSLDKSIFGDLGLTIVLASFICLTFFINLFLAVYREIMKFKDYKKAQRELSYIFFQIDNNQEYSFEEFENDYEKISDFYFQKKEISKLKILKKIVFGGKKWL
ncbi:hypothetical protein DR095_00760 [Mycoplasma flocculare]|uniref:DUF4231 domain-containing protein n=1 Tax=Mesomycoplasma flocculare TaxID=2128 RepID=A0AAW9XBD2_MESFC|nr:hypothetical protein [Mesomycoplasma flocculare]MXR39286.1 hypothetical protein [Mycoplasma sp. MF12]MXR05700.1 hypothetical protein [Mesomycoplasma flocculare]MXR12070.1 hypothetical protein [Mesomycoplasma flocculare]MXR22666.1 hypothetical protein [Mesomycoplasma flocculare]MXR55925.1 hypothetical protein [Mesomycoplasma flocculare]